MRVHRETTPRLASLPPSAPHGLRWSGRKVTALPPFALERQRGVGLSGKRSKLP